MRIRGSNILIGGSIVLFCFGVLFWTAANLTHPMCCSQEWVDSTPTAAVREERAQERARVMTQTLQLKEETQEYALFFLAGSAALAIVHSSRTRKNRDGERIEASNRTGGPPPS